MRKLIIGSLFVTLLFVASCSASLYAAAKSAMLLHHHTVLRATE